MKKICLIFIIILLLLDIVLVTAFVKFVSYSDHKESNNPICDVINNVCEITVDEGKKGTGTGIYIGSNKILTCNHLIDERNPEIKHAIKVKFYHTNDWNECTVIKASEKDDLLLLKLNQKKANNMLSSVTFGNKDSITLGMEVYSIGNTLGNGLSVSKGIVSCTYKKVVRSSSKKMGVIQTNISIENGDSGGPIFNEKGEIIGINSFRLLDSYGNPTYASSYAISIKEIEEFLFRN